jgi:hypothetical protein
MDIQCLLTATSYQPSPLQAASDAKSPWEPVKKPILFYENGRVLECRQGGFSQGIKWVVTYPLAGRAEEAEGE